MIDAVDVDIAGSLILVVDDKPENLDVMRQILEREKYQVAVALSGEKALRIVERDTRPDLILLDVRMDNGIDGFETCRRITKMEGMDRVPIIFSTAARTESKDIVAGFDLGAVDYISKPVKQKEVLVRVKTHLQIRRLSRLQEEQAERFRAIVNAMGEALFILNGEGRIVSANPSAEILFEEREETLKEIGLDDLVTDTGKGSVEGLLSGDADLEGVEHEVLRIRKDGGRVRLGLKISRMLSGKSEYVVILHDITALKRMAEIDPLTGIANRRRLFEHLGAEWEKAQRLGTSVGVILIDIDFFKDYNDHYGHPEGDRCLRKVAEAIESSVQRSSLDLVARYGGEEFCVVLLGADGGSCRTVAERIRRAVEGLAIENVKLREGATVTVSAGTAVTFPSRTDSTDLIMKEADRALYQAKNRGRNCVVSSS